CEVEEFQLSSNGQLLADLNGRPLAELELRRRTGALVLAVRMPAPKANNSSVYRGITSAPLPPKLITNPNGDVRLLPGQLLVVMGSKEELQRFAQLLGPALEGVEAMTN
ncbi:cation:proton antiporter regulatory subunit, partial [Synechococcus sp. EJ6-Ellesmere]|uniref:cation:proton antiporter regulatory subunit n=1 Tax=Synechococcus sp. EJ6-Ellesmere TaxID=2823734 RepID=UPI0020CE9B6E